MDKKKETKIKLKISILFSMKFLKNEIFDNKI